MSQSTEAQVTALSTNLEKIKISDTKTPHGGALHAEAKYHIVQIGCGVVGSAYVKAYQSKGCKVTGIEASHQLIDAYKSSMDIFHIDWHDQIATIQNVDFIMISINTPLDKKTNKLELKYLFSSLENVASIVKNSPNAQVIIRSTVPPTTTKKYHDMLTKSTGRPVSVLFQPEFLRAVSAEDDAVNPWHVVLGADKGTDTTKLKGLYCKYVKPDDITILTIEEAELLKMFHNSWNAAKISHFNQYDMIVEHINKAKGTTIDIKKIVAMMIKTCEGLRNPAYGTKTKHGYNGTLQRDSGKVAAMEEQYGLTVKLFQAVVDVNDEVCKADAAEFKEHTEYTKPEDIGTLTIEEAELLYIFSSAWNAAVISYFNQCAILVEKINEAKGTSVDINKIISTMTKTCEGLRNSAYGTKTKHGYYGTCLPKDSAELASLEKEYGLLVKLFQAVVDVNNEVCKTDKQEVLVGDHHMKYDKFKVATA